MKRVFALGFVASCLGTLVSCTEPAIETPVSQVAGAQAVPATKAAKAVSDSPPQTAEPPSPRHEVRKEVAPTADESQTATAAPGIPQVYLTSEHSAMCRVRTGDQLPAISLPQLSGGDTELATLQGKQATIVLFWGDDPWMSTTALADLARLETSADVAIVGIAVELSNSEVQAALEKSGAEFPTLVDADGKAFDQVGISKMPRVYVLNQSGEIAWFDIEYSQSTQRELKQTLDVLAGE